MCLRPGVEGWEVAPLPARGMEKCITKGLGLNCRAGKNTDPEYRGLAVSCRPSSIHVCAYLEQQWHTVLWCSTERHPHHGHHLHSITAAVPR